MTMQSVQRAIPFRRPLDATGFWLLAGLSCAFAGNNLLVKIGTEAFQPVAMAAMRSALALFALVPWMWARGLPFRFDLWRQGLLIGCFFGLEFLLLFSALDRTTVVRAALLFYAMPLWSAVMAHWLIPNERLTLHRTLGFIIGFLGVALTLTGQAGGAAALAGGDLIGDLMALLGGLCWALILITARRTRLAEAEAETVLFWQLLVSALGLALVSPLFGEGWFRAVTPLQVGNLIVQGVGVAGAAFLLWFWLLRRYPAGAVASFGFLTPILTVFLAWLLLGEVIVGTTLLAGGLLAFGLWLINRR